MGYRALFTADVHIGNTLPWAVKDPATMVTDRAMDITRVLEQMGEYALENELTDIWVIGDLIDKRQPDAVTLKLVAQQLSRLQELGLTIRLTPGNHEAGDAACRHYTLDAFASMGFWVAGQTDVARDQISVIEPVDGFSVVAIPYLPAARFERVVDGLDKRADRFDLALVHQNITGGTVGGWTCSDGINPGLLDAIAKQTLSGHFHTPQSIGKTVHYLGAPVQHNFADASDKRGFWDVTWMGTGRACVRKKVPVRDAPVFQELEWNVEGGDLPDKQRIAESAYLNLKVIGPRALIDKRWADALHWCHEARTIAGARLARPVPQPRAEAGRKRIDLGTSEDLPAWDKLLSRYLDTVDCTGLNRKTLETIGAQLMADADK